MNVGDRVRIVGPIDKSLLTLPPGLTRMTAEHHTLPWMTNMNRYIGNIVVITHRVTANIFEVSDAYDLRHIDYVWASGWLELVDHDDCGDTADEIEEEIFW